MYKNAWKKNCILKVTLSHLYIGEGTNGFCETQRLIDDSLKATCTVQEGVFQCGGTYWN